MAKINNVIQQTQKQYLLFVFLFLFCQLSLAEDMTLANMPESAGFENLPAKFRLIDKDIFELTSALIFTDNKAKKWIAIEGVITDGASIPSFFIPLIGTKFDPNYFYAAVLHDAYCAIDNSHLLSYQSEPWEKVHKMFYDAILAGGTDSNKAKIMYAAVYLGGPRWNDPVRDISKVEKTHLMQEFKWCIQLIEKRGASFDDVNNWMHKREAALIAGEPMKPKWAE